MIQLWPEMINIFSVTFGMFVAPLPETRSLVHEEPCSLTFASTREEIKREEKPHVCRGRSTEKVLYDRMWTTTRWSQMVLTQCDVCALLRTARCCEFTQTGTLHVVMGGLIIHTSHVLGQHRGIRFCIAHGSHVVLTGRALALP